MSDEEFTAVDEHLHRQAGEIYRLGAQCDQLRAALDIAANALRIGADLCEPGYRVPPNQLHRLLIQNAEKARDALGEASDVR